jgi:pimeloyl-ACP methyl ester carboxylesterase
VDRVRSSDGLSIAVWRSGNGKPLVAVHGVTVDHSLWEGVRAMLEPVATLIAIDRRGHGASELGSGPYSLAQEVSDLAAVIDACGSPVDLLAHSYGGLVALEAALLDSSLDRLIVYEPSIDDDPTFPGVLERISGLVESGQPEGAAETLLVERSGVPPDALSAVRGLPLWPIVLQGVEVLPREGKEIIDYHFEADRFANLNVPTLVLLGEESPGWRHGAMRALGGALPNSELHILAGQGHLATQTAPDLLAGEILRFIGK